MWQAMPCFHSPKAMANGPKLGLSVNLLQPMRELAGFGPTGFHEQVENFEQLGEAIGLRVVLTMENLAVVGEGALDEFHNLGDGERFVLIACFGAGGNGTGGYQKYFFRRTWQKVP